MRFMSDLHLEFDDDHGYSFVRGLSPENTDILVLAGDITNADLVHETLVWFSDRFPEVDIVYVLGNHEHYSAPFGKALAEARSICFMRPKVHVLDNEYKTIRGHRFFGATLWYPVYTDNPMWMTRWKSWSDRRWIEGAEEALPGQYERTRAALAQLERDDIVVTHMLPARQSIAEQWAGARTNDYFLAPVSDIIEDKRPQLWIHGHTHGRISYTHPGGTRVETNPRGLHWLDENPAFNPNMTIELVPRKDEEQR